MENTFIIRDVSEADFDQWRQLWDQYNEFYGRVGLTALSEDIVLSTWQRFLDPSESVYCLIAEDAGRLVGFAHYISHRNTITIENTCYLQDVFSEPDLRGKGVGRKLITEFYERAKQAGTVGVYWHTHASNETAMQLYDKVATNTGFVVYRHSVTTKPI
ncbi:MAG: GNAT family N-acetyltransferase [Anaerolineales bacterium]|nr:GNAT family N-acetyltransferase [Anaerolineales bacterium]